MRDDEFELTDLSSSPSRGRRFGRVWKTGLQSTDERHSIPEHDTHAEQYPLLLCLRLLVHHDVHIFTIGRGRRWNMREDLGKGSTFTVEQADIPMREGLTELQYHDFARGRRLDYFTDHTGTKWSYDTVVAYKSLVERKDKNAIMPDLAKELRILCHPPLQNHPNIVHLLGLAWLREEDMASSLASAESLGNREWPVLLTEKANVGSLSEFLRPKENFRAPISLLAKVRLATDVVVALSVSRTCPCVPLGVVSNVNLEGSAFMRNTTR
jgi:hypothetical protein